MLNLNKIFLTGDYKAFISRRTSINLIMLVYFLSGACSLIDEVVWVRLLKLTIGNTVYASSIVVSVFMGGLAIGALIMSRYCDNIKKPLRLYALLETFVTISALSLPYFLTLADRAYIWLYRTYQPTHTHLVIVQAVISAAMLLVPTMLMGSTLPLLAKFVTPLEKETGHLVGRLYALNTLGAMAGCFFAGFISIRVFGVMGTLYIAAALNLFVAFGGWFLFRFSNSGEDNLVNSSATQVIKIAEIKKTRGKFYLMAIAFFASGLISIGYELLWMRSIVYFLGGFTYVFSAVLSIYLLGNVIGAGIGSTLARKLKNPAAGFAITLFFLGAYGIFYLPSLIFWKSKVLPDNASKLLSIESWTWFSSYLTEPLIHCSALFLLPAIIMGIGFPLALQTWTNHIHKVGCSTGRAYAANTVGAVLGGVVTGFILIPFLGLQTSITSLGLLGIWIAGFIWIFFVYDFKITRRLIFLTLVTALTILTLRIPSDLFNRLVKTNPFMPEAELIHVEEGPTTTVSLHRDSKGILYLYSSGQTIAGENFTARGDQKILGHFGPLLNKKAKKVLSVGFGSGETTACLNKHTLEEIECVEIAPEVVDFSLRFFKHINLGDTLSKEVGIVFMDAKNYLHLTDKKYDLIVNDSIHPRLFADNASLYTKEYFDDAKKRLNNNGLYITWLPTFYMPTSVLKSIIGTMTDTFPYVTLWYLVPHPAPFVLMVASEQKQFFSPKHIEKELSRENIQNSLRAIGMHNNLDVLGCYIGDETDLKKYVKKFTLNSDGFPFVEFTTDVVTHPAKIFRTLVTNTKTASIYDHIDWSGFNKDEKKKWIKEYTDLYDALDYMLIAPLPYDDSMRNLTALKKCIRGLNVLPGNQFLLKVRKNSEKRILSECVEMIISGNARKALSLATSVLKVYPQSPIAQIIKSSIVNDEADIQRIVHIAKLVVEYAPYDANSHFNFGSALLMAANFSKAAEEFEETMRLAEQTVTFTGYRQILALDKLAFAYAHSSQLSKAIAAIKEAFELALSTGHKSMAVYIKNRWALSKTSDVSRQNP